MQLKYKFTQEKKKNPRHLRIESNFKLSHLLGLASLGSSATAGSGTTSKLTRTEINKLRGHNKSNHVLELAGERSC